MNIEELRKNAVSWMIARGWRQKIAKRGEYEQTLYDHTAIQLDVLSSLSPILKVKMGVTKDELIVILLALILHDVAKEKQEWQAYIKDETSYSSHIDEKLAREVLDELLAYMGLKDIDKEAVISGVVLHMWAERTPGKVMGRVVFGEHQNTRWKQLADLVDFIDNFVSAGSLFEGMAVLERSSFAPYFNITYHQVLVRGLSTVFLHRSALDAFMDKGWQPVIHYMNGTIYVEEAGKKSPVPSVEEIKEKMVGFLKQVLETNLEEQVVGRPTASMLPKKDLFDYEQMDTYLKIAKTRVTATGFDRKKEEDRINTFRKYSLLRCELDGLCSDPDICKKEKRCRRFWDEEIPRYLDRIGRAYQEMVVFKFFKTVFNEKTYNPEELAVLPEDEENLEKLQAEMEEWEGEKREKAEKKYERQVKKAAKKALDQIISSARDEYDHIFGKDAFDLLQSTTTFVPAIDMAYAVDLYWRLRARELDSDSPDVEVEELPDEQRKELLIKTLTGITKKAFAKVYEENRPRGLQADKVAGIFVKDLLYPAEQRELHEIITNQLKGYKETKLLARKAHGEHLCPICNQYFQGGTNARADFVDKPESHTNRAPSHGGQGYIVICDSCKFERYFRQILLGGKPAQMIVIYPRTNIGCYTGEKLMQHVEETWERLTALTSSETPDLHEKVSLSLTGIAYNKFKRSSWDKLSGEELAKVFTYKSSEERKKEMRRKFTRAIREELGENIEEINRIYETKFQDYDELIDQAISGKFYDEDGVVTEARERIYRLVPQMKLICQTPHMVLVPLRTGISMGKDSKANARLRQLFVLIVLALTLHSSVMLLEEGDDMPEESCLGIVKIPFSPGLKRLVAKERERNGKGKFAAELDKDWLTLDEALVWVDKIGAAAVLVPATDYPESNNLYQIISSPTPGHILRRIEMKRKSNVVPWSLFEVLKPFEKGVSEDEKTYTGRWRNG